MKVLFAAGGTGGHINPALAAAGMVRERHPDAQILFVGTAEKWRRASSLLRDMILKRSISAAFSGR